MGVAVVWRRRSCVMAVDDDPGMLDVVRRVLGDDHDLVLALSAEEGLRLALLRPPDVILSDVTMPGMDGLEFLRQLRSHPSLADVPVIVLTGASDQEMRMTMLRAGAHEFLVKPCAVEELRVRIDNTLQIKLACDLLREELKVQSSDIASLIGQVASRSAALEAARAAADKASQAKTAFLTLISHELGSPLTVLRLAADSQRLQLQRSKAPLEAAVRRHDDALARLEGVVESVIELVRLQGGPAELHFEPIDVESLIRDVAAQFDSQARAKGLAVTLDVTRDARTVTSDRQLLRIVLSNLVSNAIKFTETGSVAVSSCRREGTILAVRDSGRGIEARDQVRILEPFGYLETIKRKSKPGMGLGLALVREGVTRLGGSLALTSEPGRGSVFSVTLPDRVQRTSPVGEGAGGVYQ
jgi:signal transduction histidine kinase